MFRSVLAVIVFSSAVALGTVRGLAQTPQPSPAANTGITAFGVLGVVKSIDASGTQMVLKTDGGVEVAVALSANTIYKRVPPGEKTLDKATDILLSDVSEGDHVLARGRVAADQKSVPAQQLIVMSKGDIAKKHEAEMAEWRKPGVRGIVASLNTPSKEFTVSFRNMMGVQQSVIVSLSEKVDIKRYPIESIKFSDAKPSSFEDLKTGDQVRAVGERTPEGTRLKAEKILSDPHRIAGGVVTAIDLATGEVKINDLQTKKPFTVIFRPDTIVRRVPENLGMGMGMGGPGGANGGAAGAPAGQGQARPQGQPAGAPAGGQGGPQGPRMGGAGMNMADLLDRMPTISIKDLKVGDTIIMSSTVGADPTRLTAFTVVTGVEPLLAMMAARPQQGGPARGGVDLNGSFGGMFGGIGGP